MPPIKKNGGNKSNSWPAQGGPGNNPWPVTLAVTAVTGKPVKRHLLYVSMKSYLFSPHRKTGYTGYTGYKD
jgi:hypothetical protein